MDLIRRPERGTKPRSLKLITHRYCYLPLAAGSSNGVTNIRCCRYSCLRSWWWVEVPPETCRAVSRYNKLCNVASCWIYIRTSSLLTVWLFWTVPDGHSRLLHQWQFSADILTAAVQCTQTAPPSFTTFWILAQTCITNSTDHHVLLFLVYYFSFENNT